MKIIDFGFSFVNDDSKYEKVGTPLYVAPEVISGKISTASDIWSVGVMLFICVS